MRFCVINLPKISSSIGRSVAITGAGGRLGCYLVAALDQVGIRAIPMPRAILSGSPKEIKGYLKETGASAVVNSAALSQGSFNAMMEVNVNGAVKLGKVTREMRLPFFHMSSTATWICGISKAKTPYAWSKKIAKEELLQESNVTIVDLDVLLGKSQVDQIDISTLAAGGVPIAVQMLGNRHIIQPTSYQAAGKAIANLVSESVKGRPVPSSITIAGEPIALGDFVHLIKSEDFLFKHFGLEMNLQPEDLLNFAKLVNNGSLSPEFLHLGQMAASSPKIHDNEIFEHFHGDPIPTHAELADQMKKTTALDILKTVSNIYKDSSQKLDLSIEALRVWQKCSVKKIGMGYERRS